MQTKYFPNILLVDDNYSNLKYLEAVLKGVEANLITARSGAEAVLKMKKYELALAIVDIQMPNMDGFELASIIKKENPQKLIPIIFLTAFFSDKIQIFKGYDTGAVDYLIKPVERPILLGKVNIFLELDRQRNQILESKSIFNQMEVEQLQIKQTLKKSEDKFQSIFEESPIGICLFHTDGRINCINDVCLKQFGISGLEEAKKFNLFDNKLTSSEAENLRKGNIIRNEFLFDFDRFKKQGYNTTSSGVLFFDVLINPIGANQGEITGYVAQLRDVTERKTTELRMKRRLEFEKITSTISSRFVGIFNLDDAINESLKDIGEYYGASWAYLFMMDKDRAGMSNTHEWCNGSISLKMDQYKNISLDKLDWFLGKLEEDNRIHIHDVTRFFDEIEGERRILLAQNTHSIVMLPINIKGELKGFIGFNDIEGAGKWSEDDFDLLKVFSDVLASTFHRRQVEMELLESEEMYRTLLNASPDGIVITNLNGRITEVSNIALELYGSEDAHSLIGKRFFEFIPKELHKKALRDFSKTLSEGLIQNVELNLIRKDQSQFIGEISTTLIQEPNGNPKAFMAIVRDITQRKKMEKHLIHTERMAGIGGMAAGIAHEINQPLNTISMSMDNILFALRNDNMDERYLENKASKIFDNIFRMRNIIDHVRTFSRDYDDYILSAFNVNESISNAISMISEQFKHKGIQLDVEFAQTIASPVGNTYKFEQVILNLLSNAKDATEEKKKIVNGAYKKHIEIKTYQLHENIYVEVRDNGIGVDSEEINNILLPFYTTKKEGEGTGLGLSISFGIIKEMNGNIEIQSKHTEGTLVKISLPIGRIKE